MGNLSGLVKPAPLESAELDDMLFGSLLAHYLLIGSTDQGF